MLAWPADVPPDDEPVEPMSVKHDPPRQIQPGAHGVVALHPAAAVEAVEPLWPASGKSLTVDKQHAEKLTARAACVTETRKGHTIPPVDGSAFGFASV
jgi:hypothetical protein